MSAVLSMNNPFDAEEENLVGLASGLVVEDKIADKLQGVEKMGEEQFIKFARVKVGQRLEGNKSWLSCG